MAFLPRGRVGSHAGRALIERVVADDGLTFRRWRTVPFDRSALGAGAAASRPLVLQAVIGRPAGASDPAFERRLVIVRRRIESASRSTGRPLADLSIPSASCRTVVYKGLVAGTRLADLYPDLRAPLEVAYAVFHQR